MSERKATKGHNSLKKGGKKSNGESYGQITWETRVTKTQHLKNDEYDESGGPLLNEEGRYVMKLEINNLWISTIPEITQIRK